MEHHDDGTGSEKEERLEKCVSKKVKHGRFARGETHRHHHIAKLRKRGVSQDALDIVLLRRDQGGDHGGDRPDPRDDQKCSLRSLNDKSDPN